MLKKLTLLLIVSFTFMAATFAANSKFTLVIDAGHGGHDSGAVGAISQEKNINLRTALAFGKYVEANCPDVNVIYTRKTDVFVTLHGRAEIANKAKADLFMSIHTNSVGGSKTARGFETYTLGMHRAGDNLDIAKRENSVILVEKDYKQHYQGFDPNSAESYIIFEFMQDHNMAKSVELAKLVQSNVTSIASRVNKGVKQAGFLVLRETSMPSCLIELGFISTPDEEQALNNATVIDNIAKGIYNAFVAYKTKYDASNSHSYKKETSASEANTSTSAKKEEVASDKETAEVKKQKAEPKQEETTATKKAEPAPAKKQQPAPAKKENERDETASGKKTEAPAKKKETEDKNDSRPVFKVQIFVEDNVLSTKSTRFKGHSDASYYKENGMVKYTIGSSTNYNEIYRLRKELVADFPDCFIIAFKNGEKTNINEAIREFKANK